MIKILKKLIPFKKTIRNLLSLSRFKDFLEMTTLTSLLGYIISNVDINIDSFLKFITVYIANLLVVAFSFMINDIEDAEDDYLDINKRNRNVISNKKLRKNTGYFFTFLTAISSLVLFNVININVFIIGILSVLTSFLYSWKKVRLKSKPIIDLFSHSFMLAGFQFIASYFAFTNYYELNSIWILPLLALICVSMHDEIYNEIRDIDIDTKTNIVHTAFLIGIKNANILMNLLLVCAFIITGIIFYLEYLPFWLLFIFLIKLCILIIYRWIKYRILFGDLQKLLLRICILLLLILIYTRIY